MACPLLNCRGDPFVHVKLLTGNLGGLIVPGVSTTPNDEQQRLIACARNSPLLAQLALKQCCPPSFLPTACLSSMPLATADADFMPGSCVVINVAYMDKGCVSTVHCGGMWLPAVVLACVETIITRHACGLPATLLAPVPRLRLWISTTSFGMYSEWIKRSPQSFPAIKQDCFSPLHATSAGTKSYGSVHIGAESGRPQGAGWTVQRHAVCAIGHIPELILKLSILRLSFQQIIRMRRASRIVQQAACQADLCL
eukprot:365817-Chlamydomonas_euryale.AAC.6